MTWNRPEWLKPFAEVIGWIHSAPLDLSARLDATVRQLRAEGWTVVVRSVGTDFDSGFGVPLPRAQRLHVLLHRTDRPYTPKEAHEALSRVLSGAAVTYSAWGAWAGELAREVITPTVEDARALAMPSLAAAGVVVAIVGLAMFGRRD